VCDTLSARLDDWMRKIGDSLAEPNP